MRHNILLFLFGVAFISILIYISIAFPSTISQYFGIYKTILAVACAGIAAIVPGFFHLRYKDVIRAGGALGVFTFIVLFIKPSTEFFQVRVILNDVNHHPIIEKGKIRMIIGGEQREMPVQAQNDALFENIPARYLNTKAKIGLDFTENYIPEYPDSLYTLSENQIINFNIRLKLETTIRGMVTFGNKPLPDVNVSINGLKTTTDGDGNYTITLPAETTDDEQVISFYKAPFKLKRIPIHLQTLKELDVVMEQ